MNNISIYKNNTLEARALLGEEIKGKGHEVYTFPVHIESVVKEFYPLETIEKNIKSILDRTDLDNCFVYQLTQINANGIRTTFQINENNLEEIKLSKEKYPIKQTLEKFLNDKNLIY